VRLIVLSSEIDDRDEVEVLSLNKSRVKYISISFFNFSFTYFTARRAVKHLLPHGGNARILIEI
jgi:hypothetical protein